MSLTRIDLMHFRSLIQNHLITFLKWNDAKSDSDFFAVPVNTATFQCDWDKSHCNTRSNDGNANFYFCVNFRVITSMCQILMKGLEYCLWKKYLVLHYHFTGNTILQVRFPRVALLQVPILIRALTCTLTSGSVIRFLRGSGVFGSKNDLPKQKWW